MTLIRFDPSGAVNPEEGITLSEIDSVAAQLAQQCHRRREDGPWLRLAELPRATLAAYDSVREASELGRIFQVAQRLHEQVDAMVVLGRGGWNWGTRALVEACCHPYHNESSRGRRGSKPRLYFESQPFDNDVTAGLIHRLADVHGDDPTLYRWGICVVDPDGDCEETTVAASLYLRAMQATFGATSLRDLSSLIFAITKPKSPLHTWTESLGGKELFVIPEGIGESQNVFSAVGLLPAAIIGLDCMQLLKGAAEMTVHFHTATPEQNVVLRFAAVNQLLHQRRGIRHRVLCLWNQVLEGIGRWHERLNQASAGRGGECFATSTQIAPRDFAHNVDCGIVSGKTPSGSIAQVFHQITVRAYRSDALQAPALDGLTSTRDSMALRSVPELMKASIQSHTSALHRAGYPTTEIELPDTNVHAVGQWMQMLMLVNAIESSQWS